MGPSARGNLLSLRIMDPGIVPTSYVAFCCGPFLKILQPNVGRIRSTKLELFEQLQEFVKGDPFEL